MKHPRLSALCLAVSTVLVSAACYAGHGNYKGENYKGEAMPVCPPPPMLMDGFYVGVQAGYDTYRVRAVSDLANVPVNDSGWEGGLFVGYGKYFDPSNYAFYLGGEIFGNYNNSSETINVLGPVYSATFKARGSYGVALLPGIRLNNTTLGYVRLGYNWASLKGSENFASGAATGSKTHTSNGFNFGVGIETLLVDDWSLRGEFSHTYYSDFTSSFGTTFKPSDNLFTLGLIYHFA
jgi:opacity protein-like surface antigen